MEMQNVIAHLSMSENISSNLTATSEQFSYKKGNFDKMMSEKMQDNKLKDKKELSNARSTRTVSDKRQSEMLRSSNNTETKTEFEKIKSEQELQTESSSLETVDLTNQNQQIVSKWNEDVEKQVCKELDITPEELEMFMAQLGLQLGDLQNLLNLQQLILKASGESDKMFLLTDENLGTKLQNLMESISSITENIQKQFGGSKEDFFELLENCDVVSDNDMIENSSNMVDAELLQSQQASVSERVATPLQESKEDFLMKEDVTITSETEQESSFDNKLLQPTENDLENISKVAGDNVKKMQLIVEAIEQNPVAESALFETDVETIMVEGRETQNENAITTDEILFEVSAEEMKVSHTAEKKDSHFNGGNDQSMFEQFMSHLTAEKVNNTENASMKATVVEQMREIVKQVVEQIKVTIKPNTSAMEIQLNPENLGKVNLSVVAKEGHITAQFVTETEMAKHALESQMQQLRETLGEQGLKVDEVEVTVSNFDFNQSNQANAEEQKQQQRQQSVLGKKVIRNLNINNMDELEDMTEEEQLTAKIMQLNGNQVDYTA